MLLVLASPLTGIMYVANGWWKQDGLLDFVLDSAV
jgi:hypothetical protein